MKAAVLACIVALATSGCARITGCDHDGKPGVLDQAADVGKGVLCGSAEPPAFLPWSDSDAFRTGWQVARALLCSPEPEPEKPAPAIAADVDVTATP